MAPLPLTGSNARSIAMQFTQVAYGGCWKRLHAWQRCSASTPRLAASQKGFVHSFGTGIGLVTWLHSLIVIVSSPPIRPDSPTREPGCWPPAAMSRARASSRLLTRAARKRDPPVRRCSNGQGGRYDDESHVLCVRGPGG